MVTLSDSSVVDLVSQARLVFMRLLSSCDTCDTIFNTLKNREREAGFTAGWRRHIDFSVTSVTLAVNPIIYAVESVTLDCLLNKALLSLCKKEGGGCE